MLAPAVRTRRVRHCERGGRTGLFLLPLSLLAAAVPARAQDERLAEVRERNDCRLAAQVLATGHPHPRYEWARSTIVNCEDEGPAYFASQWRTAPADTAALRLLIAAASRVRDARVYATCVKRRRIPRGRVPRALAR